MYLTAQRVIDPMFRRRGVNTYKYVHGFDWFGDVPENFLPEHNPGVLQGQTVEIAPGGNRIFSYLDFVAPDSFDGNAATMYLASLKHVVDPANAMHGIRVGPIWVRFGMSQELRLDPGTEMSALAGYLVLNYYSAPR